MNTPPSPLEGSDDELTRLRAERDALAGQLERVRVHAALREDIGRILSGSEPTATMLEACVAAVVERLDAAFARVWLFDAEAAHLELRASAGLFTSLEGATPFIPLGTSMVGQIAETRQPCLSNDVQREPRLAEVSECLREHQLTSFAGYPLLVEGRLVGVMAMFAAQALSPDVIEVLGAIAGLMAQGIERKQAQDRLAALALRLGEEAEEKGRELQRHRALIERLIAHAPVGIAFLDGRGVIRWANDTFAEWGGAASHQLVDREIYEVFPQMTNPSPRLVEALDTGRTVSAQSFAYPADGPAETVRYYDFTYVPQLDSAGRVEGVLLLSLDVTSRVHQERDQHARIVDLQRADALKDQFLSILSHELRTPINAIMGFGSVLDDEVLGPLNPQQHKYMQRLLASADNLLALVSDLLDLTRIQAGKFTLSPGPLLVGPLAEAVVQELVLLAAQKGQRLSCELGPYLPELEGDAQRIAQVIRNLVANAIKFTPKGGAICLSVGLSGKALRVAVADDGPGIPLEDLPRLFQPFSQLDMSLTRASGGVGLGLAISKSLVEAHGGRVGVESAPGCGSTFWFALPLSRPARGAPAVGAPGALGIE